MRVKIPTFINAHAYQIVGLLTLVLLALISHVNRTTAHPLPPPPLLVRTSLLESTAASSASDFIDTLPASILRIWPLKSYTFTLSCARARVGEQQNAHTPRRLTFALNLATDIGM
jgi:hypothetical protein